jgi:ferredoxin--NADP+ reductase
MTVLAQPRAEEVDVAELNAIVTQRVDFAPDLMILRVAPDGWELPVFKPGQYCLLGLPPSAPRAANAGPEADLPEPDEMIRRAYSIASSSAEREYVEFYVAHVHSGALTPRLFALGVGDRVFLSAKFTGMFTLDQVPADQNLIFIGTGTGLAPYMSMIRTHVEADQDHRVLVLHGARNSWDLGYRTELFYLQRYAPHFTYVPVIDGPQDEVVPWTGHVGFAQDLWKSGLVSDVWGHDPTPENSHVFLCGNPLMIAAMKDLLFAEGFTLHHRRTPGQVHVEEF